jgi:Holliday junction resolvasome RuvABC DNA-binding subunit
MSTGPSLMAKATHFGLMLGTLLDLGYSPKEIRAMFSQSNIKAGIEILGRAQEGKKA